MNPGRTVLAAATGLFLLFTVLCGLPILAFGNQALACGLATPTTPTGTPLAAFGRWSPTQVTHAATIVAVGQQKRIPPRGWVIALATAMTESGIRNLANAHVPTSLVIAHEGVGADHDSVGLFQQRPLPPEGAGGWGTVAELMTPAIAARKFYTKLTTIPGWQSLPLGHAAQAVQISAFPDAYARWEAPAAELAGHVTGMDLSAFAGSLSGAECGVDGAPLVISPGGWTAPVVAVYDPTNAFRSRQRPTHQGVDLMAARHTPIRAAAAGKVITAACNTSNSSCDIDGSPAVSGCGWYVEIAHAKGVVTRYCHLGSAPNVTVGDAVTVGQTIGQVGSSGNSSGPHLHFEVHLVPAGQRAASNNATDPVAFMTRQGVRLGPA